MKKTRKNHLRDKSKRGYFQESNFRRSLHNESYGSERRAKSNILAKFKNALAKDLLIDQMISETLSLVKSAEKQISNSIVRKGFYDLMY